MKKKTEITKKMTFAEIIEKEPEMAMKLAEQGLFCGGCPMAQMETLEQGARAHGLDPDKLIKNITKKKK